MLCIIYLCQVCFPHFYTILHTDEFINLHLPDTYTVVTVQVVLGRRLSEKQWDVDQVFW